jgi:hypothetical protein
LHIVDDPWETGEMLLPTSFGKDKIWERLQGLRTIPEVSQFVIWSGRQEVTKLDKWPVGKLVAVPHTFLVKWEIENPRSLTGFDEVTQEKMTPMITATEAWQFLHNDQPGLFEGATLYYRGKLKPGIYVRAEVIRKPVEVAVEFVVIHQGKIRFIHENIPNMATWAEIHAQLAYEDRRIPPFSCYVDKENLPHYENTLLEFRLVGGMEIPDTTGAFGGAAGGVSPGGYVLPPIVFPKARLAQREVPRRKDRWQAQSTVTQKRTV